MLLKAAKYLVVIVIGCIVSYASYIGYALFRLPSIEGLADRTTNMTIQVNDWHGKPHPFIVGPENRYWTALEGIPLEMKWAVIVAEDAKFLTHTGIDIDATKQTLTLDTFPVKSTRRPIETQMRRI